MVYKFTYITVQNSGTRFLERYFLHIGLSPQTFVQAQKVDYSKYMNEKNLSGLYEYVWRHYSYEKPRDTKTYAQWEMVVDRPNYPVVSTLRHPYKTAISFLVRGHDLQRCVYMWDNFIRESILRTRMVYFDIDCPEEYRKLHLLDTMQKVGCVDDETEQLTEEFVDNWKPVGVYRSDMKDKYLESGILPDGFNWSRLDRAVNWYERTIEKVHDNFPS